MARFTKTSHHKIRPASQKPGIVPLLVILSVMAVGLLLLRLALAAGTAFYISPTSATVTPNSTLTVAVRINTAGEAINAVQVNLSYPAADLQYTGTDNSGSAFPLVAETNGGGGSVRLARATSPGTPPITGDYLIATVSFKVLGSTGSADIIIASGSAAVRASDNTDVLSSVSGGNYVLTGFMPPPPPPVSMSSSPSPLPASPSTSPGASPPPTTATRTVTSPSDTIPLSGSQPTVATPSRTDPGVSQPLAYTASNPVVSRQLSKKLLGGAGFAVLVIATLLLIHYIQVHRRSITRSSLPPGQQFFIGGSGNLSHAKPTPPLTTRDTSADSGDKEQSTPL